MYMNFKGKESPSIDCILFISLSINSLIDLLSNLRNSPNNCCTILLISFLVIVIVKKTHLNDDAMIHGILPPFLFTHLSESHALNITCHRFDDKPNHIWTNAWVVNAWFSKHSNVFLANRIKCGERRNRCILCTRFAHINSFLSQDDYCMQLLNSEKREKNQLLFVIYCMQLSRIRGYFTYWNKSTAYSK